MLPKDFEDVSLKFKFTFLCFSPTTRPSFLPATSGGTLTTSRTAGSRWPASSTTTETTKTRSLPTLDQDIGMIRIWWVLQSFCLYVLCLFYGLYTVKYVLSYYLSFCLCLPVVLFLSFSFFLSFFLLSSFLRSSNINSVCIALKIFLHNLCNLAHIFFHRPTSPG